MYFHISTICMYFKKHISYKITALKVVHAIVNRMMFNEKCDSEEVIEFADTFVFF